MNRTQPDIQRRRNLADAASGYMDRTRVVLYVLAKPAEEPEEVLAALRAYAEARDWVVVDFFVDRCPITTTCTDREAWAKVAGLVEAGEVRGVIAPAEQQIVSSSLDQEALCAWLDRHMVFAAYLSRPDLREAPAMETAG